MVTDDQWYISFGSGLRFKHEDWYVRAFGNGMTHRGFRALCRALGVPMLRVARERYVDMFSFEVAMRAVMRIGEPDFFVPGSATVRKTHAERRGARNKLDPTELKKNFAFVVRDLLAARKVNDGQLTRDVIKGARRAAERMVQAGLQHMPATLQAFNDHNHRYKERKAS
jgi:hypothetical protein